METRGKYKMKMHYVRMYLLYRINRSHLDDNKRGACTYKGFGFYSICVHTDIKVPRFTQIPLEPNKSQIHWPIVGNVLWGDCIFTLNKIKLGYKNRRSSNMAFWVVVGLLREEDGVNMCLRWLPFHAEQRASSCINIKFQHFCQMLLKRAPSTEGEKQEHSQTALKTLRPGHSRRSWTVLYRWPGLVPVEHKWCWCYIYRTAQMNKDRCRLLYTLQKFGSVFEQN